MQGQVIGQLADNHLRQQRSPGDALLNRLRRFGGRLHRARAGILLAHILDYLHLRRNILVALTDFLADPTQVLAALFAVFLAFRQVVLDALAFEVTR